jgi:hypothetical protein
MIAATQEFAPPPRELLALVGSARVDDTITRAHRADRRAYDRMVRREAKPDRAPAPVVSPARASLPRPRQRRTARRPATARAGSGDSDGEPAAPLTPALERFLDWLADEAFDEAVKSCT